MTCLTTLDQSKPLQWKLRQTYRFYAILVTLSNNWQNLQPARLR